MGEQVAPFSIQDVGLDVGLLVGCFEGGAVGFLVGCFEGGAVGFSVGG